jgi:hypothetical protein
MRKVIFGVIAMLCLSGMPAHSFTLEGIAQTCHAWSESNFAASIDRELELDTGTCIGFFGAFRDAGVMNCMLQKQLPDLKFAAYGFHNNYSIKQLVQLTLNFKRDNPDKWDVSPAVLWLEILPNPKCD